MRARGRPAEHPLTPGPWGPESPLLLGADGRGSAGRAHPLLRAELARGSRAFLGGELASAARAPALRAGVSLRHCFHLGAGALEEEEPSVRERESVCVCVCVCVASSSSPAPASRPFC